MKGPRSTLAVTVAALACCSACGNMQEQPRYDPYESNSFYADNMSARPFIEGTVPRQQNAFGAQATFPMPLTADVLQAGEEHYTVYCSPCHARTGDGNGMIVQRGFQRPPNFLDPRLVEAPPGYLFDVISNGFGAMPSYGYVLAPDQRWAVVAYVRALQLLRTSRSGP